MGDPPKTISQGRWSFRFAAWLVALSLPLGLPQDSTGAESRTVPHGLAFHGRREQNFRFQATVLSNRHVTMVTQSPSTALDVVETREGKRFLDGRFLVENVKPVEQTPAAVTFDSFVVTVHDSYTGRHFALSHGVQTLWPEYSALLSWGGRHGGGAFLVREGAEFQLPQSGRRERFRVITVGEEFVLIANAADPKSRFRLVRGG